MFFRTKTSGPRTYLQVVENRWEGGRSRQRVVATLGRLDQLQESGQLDALLVSGAMAFVQGSTSFHALRFLLGAAEAGFFPGIILYLSYWFPSRSPRRGDGGLHGGSAALDRARLAEEKRAWLVAL